MVHETGHSACGIIILSISDVSKRKKIRRSERRISQETKMKLSPILLSAVTASSKVERSASTGKHKFLFFIMVSSLRHHFQKPRIQGVRYTDIVNFVTLLRGGKNILSNNMIINSHFSALKSSELSSSSSYSAFELKISHFRA